MATLTQEMKDMIGAQLSFIATTDATGYPQIGPKGTLRVLDDHHLIYNEHTGKQAWQNVQVNPRVVVATVDHPKFKGFRFEGPVEIHTDDEIFASAKKFAADSGHLPEPKAAIVVDITKIYLLDAGPHAGDLIEG
ncbi:pyridoxamine 5'-phosphate oxidase family protein [Enterococcus sp. AZ103]|uniref:pyridoxamine 5'-phosphate oxidase family protein n=1 Tax=Enterococcus sp. AZ103 TaxID=2774628 RepID=UPI003F23664C